MQWPNLCSRRQVQKGKWNLLTSTTLSNWLSNRMVRCLDVLIVAQGGSKAHAFVLYINDTHGSFLVGCLDLESNSDRQSVIESFGIGVECDRNRESARFLLGLMGKLKVNSSREADGLSRGLEGVTRHIEERP